MRDANLFDAAVRYKNTFNDTIDLSAIYGVGYNWRQGFSGARIPHTERLRAAIHSPSELHAGRRHRRDHRRRQCANFWWVPAGFLRGFWRDRQDRHVDRLLRRHRLQSRHRGGHHESTRSPRGVAFVQNIDKANTQLWLTWRNYQFSTAPSSFDDGNVVSGGARFKF